MFMRFKLFAQKKDWKGWDYGNHRIYNQTDGNDEICTDEIKQLTYNFWSKFCNYTESKNIVHEKDPVL